MTSIRGDLTALDVGAASTIDQPTSDGAKHHVNGPSEEAPRRTMLEIAIAKPNRIK